MVMMRILGPCVWALAVVAGVNFAVDPATAQPSNAAAECERLAADAYDYERGTDPPAAEDPATLARAEVACRAAVHDNSEDVRPRFGLGRTLLLQEREEGLDHLRWAAERGYAAAQYRLSEYMLGGRLALYPPRDIDRGAQWAERAAEQGHREAQYLLGIRVPLPRRLPARIPVVLHGGGPG